MLITDQMMIDAYLGTGGFQTGEYLVRHSRELTADYESRKSAATYRNYVRKVVGAYIGTLFATSANRMGDAPAWQVFQANADGIGGQIDDVMRRAMVLALLLGTVHLVVDRPRGHARSRAEELDLPPYVVIRRPHQIAHLLLDELGAVEAVVYREQDADQTWYRGWDRERWWVARDPEGRQLLDDADGEPRAGNHGLARAPVVMLHSTELLDIRDPRAEPWAGGLVAAAVDLYNRHSEARAIERDQTVSTLALPVVDQQEADRIREAGLTIGSSNAVLYNPAGGGKPGYFAPPPDPLNLIYQAIAANVREIYELANLEFIGGVQQSGVALSFHFAAANRTLALFSSALESAEQAVGRLACDWLGQDGADVRVSYPKTFDVGALSAQLQEDLDALSLNLGPHADQLIRARAARRVLGDYASPDDLEVIDRELAQGADPYGDRVAQALGGEGNG